MKKRSNGFPLGGAIALCALALVGTANAQTDILSATVSSNLTSITIKGTGLQPASGKPTVSLGSYSLGVANNFTNVEIVAALPADLKPGTYNLEVTANGTANFDVAIGSDGPAGPVGPAGPAGPAGPQGAPGTSITLPFIGTVASADGAAFTLVNTAGLGMAVLGGVTGGGGTAAIGALGGGGSGVTTGGPALSGTGGTGVNGGDGIDVTGGVGDVGGSGISATGGAGNFSGNGVYATGATGANGGGTGILGQGGGVSGSCNFCFAGTGGNFAGGQGPAGTQGGDGVDAYAGAGVGLYAQGNTGGAVAGEFNGDVDVEGNLSKSGGSFKIDHPLDPANKYLYHSFVESPDMMNVYNGNVTTDGGGHAVVTLPDWFQALNSDFRYQLTTIGQPAHAWVASKVNQNAFAIRTDKPNVEVSWQVTGIRQDAWANAHRIPVEADKDKADQGHYLHPELFDHADEPSIAEMHHPRPKKRQQQQ
jgi:hypothetical protein